MDLSSLAPFSVVLEASGANVLDEIIGATWGAGLIAPRARVLIIAGRDQVTYNFNAAQGHEVAVLHAGHFDQSDLEQVTRHAAAGRLKIRPLIQDVVPISEAPRIYETLRDRPNDLLGTVFIWP
jgi:threonine dehydrogenase-like Zn-dependent dehydrogenase